MLTAASLAKALGGKREGGIWRAPCPAHRDRTPSLAIKDGANGVPLFYCHAGCPQEAVLAALKARGLWPLGPVRANGKPTPLSGFPPRLTKLPAHSGTIGQVEQPVSPISQVAGDAGRVSAALDIWLEAVDPRDTLAERYLHRRELELPEIEPARVLRFHPRLRALIALFTSIEGDEPTGIHRIFLDEHGDKRDKKMLGVVKGSAVKLDADEDVTLGLHITEGIETALAARALGYRPAWALGSAGQIAAFPVLAGIEAITVMADNDASKTGLKVAKACIDRWHAAGREAVGFMPRGVGCDFADEVGAR